MKMGKKVREYKAGDFIFAKVKGYPAWPARVQRQNGKKYFVFFYGTGETANLPPNMIFDYAENKEKFLTKTVKRRDFNDGVKQIEYDFANNIPLEQALGVEGEADPANDTVNEGDETVGDTTVDDSMADESTANTTQNDTAVEDSDETGGLVIDETKAKGKKPAPKTPAKEKPQPKTPKGKGKKEETEEKEDKEEIVSRSGRKIRPKRYMDEHTEENTTLPSPAPKKRRGASPTTDKEDKDDKDKISKQYNIMPQSELEELKEPVSSDDEKENILIAYLPSGQYVGIKLFQSRPSSFKNEAARLKWDKQQASNAITLKTQLERGQITAQSVVSQLIMDLSLTDEEKAMLDKERETEEKISRIHFLKTEVKMMELDAKIKTCLCLEKADTETCLKHLDELQELPIKPLMLLKHPSSVETVKRMRAYIGNTPSWDLSESDAVTFSKHAHQIRKLADTIYNSMKKLFTIPEGLSFWEFFTERVEQFKKVTSKLTSEQVMEMVHEPIEMSQPTSHTMKSAVESANDIETTADEQKKKQTPAKAKKVTPAKTPVKRQNSKKQLDKEEEKSQETESDEKDKEEKDSENTEKAESMDTDEQDTDKEKTEQNEDKEPEDKTQDAAEESTEKETESNDTEEQEKDTVENEEKDKVNSQEKPKDSKESKEKSKEPEKKAEKRKLSTENSKEKSKESTPEEKTSKEEEKDSKEDEPKAKRTRETKKTEAPPPRSPNKRKSKC